jgi:primosomal protein N' (replication factor Y) (superfamily II helicase)
MGSNTKSVKVSVLLPVPLEQTFDYLSEKPLLPGTLVKVPFGPRTLYGITWPHPSSPAPKSLKPVTRVFESVCLPEVSLKFIEWVGEYTLSPMGQILKMALPTPDVFEATGEPLYGLAQSPQRLTSKRKQVIDYLKNFPDLLSLPEIAEKTKVSENIIRVLMKEGVLTLQGERPWVQPQAPSHKTPQKPQLSMDQLVASEDVKKSIENKSFQTFLLEGVTGSGKTEVYFESIDHVLKHGGQALIMLPEIALTAQWLQRFESRFGFQPAIWHSDIKQSQRKATLRSLLEGNVPVVVGARSALFLPYPDLKLIIVDEEHDGSYKQEEGVIYNARDMAVVRARLSHATCVLASATPSLETELNVRSGKYRHIRLADRYGGAEMPTVELIDLRKVQKSSKEWLSPHLRQALIETLERGEQSMLFLNRRGYAPLMICQSCGDRMMCPHCSVSLVHHKSQDKLLCHHCGYLTDIPPSCSACQEEKSYSSIGPGVERIFEEVSDFLPQARCSLMTSDQLSSPQKVFDLVNKIQTHDLDILIGTQIMAKGHHFPLLTLVGIVDGDSALTGSDLRASEKSFQLLHQVSGRSGREKRKGRVLLQTHVPEHPVMQALVRQDRSEFFAFESDQRLAHGFPPFGRLAAVIVSGRHKGEVEKGARYLARCFPLTEKAELLGPTPAPLSFLRGQHRWRLLVKTAKEYPPQPLLKHWLSSAKLPRSLRIQTDIDPYSFL